MTAVKSRYRPDIDGLRAMAVLPVVAFHAFPTWVTGGFIGVDIFFVISGFLISRLILEELAHGTFTFSGFFARRIKRIFPALILVLACCYAFGWFALFSDEFQQLGKHIAAGAGFSSNIILWFEAGYFDNSGETKPLLHLWSLGIEEQFYILWPLLIWACWKKKANILLLCAGLFALSFIGNAVYTGKDPVTAFFSPLTRFWELLAGALVAVVFYRKKVESIGALPQAPCSLPHGTSLLGAILLLCGIFFMDETKAFPGFWALLPVCGATLIIASGKNGLFNRLVLSHPAVVWIGLISYPLYLWHWPLLSFARIIEGDTPDRVIRIGAFALSILLAWLTYVGVEKPVRFGAPSALRTALLILLMVASGAAGYATYKAQGYPARASIKDYINNNNELIRTPTVDEACLSYIGTKSPAFPICRFENADSPEVVAVIGDSHAHTAFPGMAEILKDRKISTLLMANSGCPVLKGAPTGKDQKEKNLCNARIEQILEIILSKKEIEKVYLFTRGAKNLTGREPLTGDRDMLGSAILSAQDYKNGLQATIDTLHNAGKKVTYVMENPELKWLAETCTERPFRQKSYDCRPIKQDVIDRYRQYTDILSQVRNVTVIDTLDLFCPSERCKVFENGILLYADDDHLSVTGSRFQATKILESDQSY